ncbi:MAG: Glutamate 2,3-aminomutase [bacterium ADurb.Bin236]|nr:MAG: Glutamate 2,3-aminomutase [bacterium ADurb.Bin236]
MKIRRVDTERYTKEALKKEAAPFMRVLAKCKDLKSARRRLYNTISSAQYELADSDNHEHVYSVIRDCARALRSMIPERSEDRAGYSVLQAIWDIACARPRPDLSPAFFADVIHLFNGLQGKVELGWHPWNGKAENLEGREAAIARSDYLDSLWAEIESLMRHSTDGMTEAAQVCHRQRKTEIQAILGCSEAEWDDWKWQIRNIVRDPETLRRIVNLTPDELERCSRTHAARLPFGITPYYASLMDADPESGKDRAIRAQVIPPSDYLDEMIAHHHERERAFDFMLERDTSPINLVTRRYPAIAILKPFNTCPQICVYCQRNWEIEAAMSPDALAPWDEIENACRWIESHPAIREVLITGGDPLALEDTQLKNILERVANIRSVDLIRVGTRTPATMPMRITDELADLLGSLRSPGKREVCIVTHVEHPYEVTPNLVSAVDRLRRQGIGVYNQLVYTFYVSRRFEAAHLRLLLRRAGIDPYYTFVPKGKEETRSYRVPIARILQEQKEEARLLPGTRRTDETVYNLPGLGKNYLRAIQHRDLISILPDGSRVYVYHPWEKNITRCNAYISADVPILEYLDRLLKIGEDKEDYESIWYYF